MPLCFIYTNLSESDIAGDLEEKLQSCVAEVLSKPAERITVIVNAGTRMTFAGSKQPGLVCQIHSINVFDPERNPGYFPKIFEVLTACTNLPSNRITVEFVDLPQHMVKTGT